MQEGKEEGKNFFFRFSERIISWKKRSKISAKSNKYLLRYEGYGVQGRKSRKYSPEIVTYCSVAKGLSNQIIRDAIATINWVKKAVLTSWLMKLKHTASYLHIK